MKYISAEDLKQRIRIQQPSTYDELEDLIDDMLPLDIHMLFELFQRYEYNERKGKIKYDT